MHRMKILQRLTLFTLICALLFLPLLVVRGQDSRTITGTGTWMYAETPSPLTITFAPAGGLVTGSGVYQGVALEAPTYWSDGTLAYTCYGSANLTMEGTFAGGDGGAASGTLTITHTWNQSENCEGYTTPNLIPNATWSGNFYADGTANGFLYAYKPWQVTYSPEEFQAALPVQITSEYIYTTYGIRVEDSFGDDKWDQKSWSDHELSLLNDVLKELPPGFLNHIALTRIVRNKEYIDADGNPIPGARGVYTRCDLKTDPQCTGSLTTIRIFDSAATILNDFPNDPDKQFKATILHEITHAYQTYKDGNSIYKDSNDSPLSENYRDATRPDTTLEAVRNGGWNNNGWGLYPGFGWYLYSAPGNEPPTNYGKTTPGEDMSESVMMYVYDPQRLQASSMQRYNFIKDQMFGGIEYENGVQKKP